MARPFPLRDDEKLSNAIVAYVTIHDAGRGLLTSDLLLEYGDFSQAFGGFCLHLPDNYRHASPAAPNYAGVWFWRVMAICGASSLDDVRGKTIRAIHSERSVRAIGHIVKDDWFEPEIEFQVMRDAIDKLRGFHP